MRGRGVDFFFFFFAIKNWPIAGPFFIKMGITVCKGQISTPELSVWKGLKQNKIKQRRCKFVFVLCLRIATIPVQILIQRAQQQQKAD